MMVLEKTRDIAILMSMGATNENIRRIFILQRRDYRVIGTFLESIIGQMVCYFADKYHLISLAPDVYTIRLRAFQGCAARLGDRCRCRCLDQLFGHTVSFGRGVEAATCRSAAIRMSGCECKP